MVQRDPNAEPSEKNHREPVVCSTAHAVACQLMRVRPAGRRTLQERASGLFRDFLRPTLHFGVHMFSFREGVQRPRDRETLYFAGINWSEREDLNLRPLVSQTSALTGLRHAPMPFH